MKLEQLGSLVFMRKQGQYDYCIRALGLQEDNSYCVRRQTLQALK